MPAIPIFSESDLKIQEILRPDRQEIDRFVRAIFKHATIGFISHRAFTHEKPSNKFGRSLEKGDDGKKHYVWPSTPVTDLDAVINMAVKMADLCANAKSEIDGLPG